MYHRNVLILYYRYLTATPAVETATVTSVTPDKETTSIDNPTLLYVSVKSLCVAIPTKNHKF